MARGVNKVLLLGNCGKDADMRYMPSGGAVTNVTIATSESWTDKNTNEKKEKTEWHNVVFFNKLGEIAGQYLKKGSQVYIEGSLRTRKWEKDGIERYTTEIVASDMQMLGGKSSNSGERGEAPANRKEAQPTGNQMPAQDGGFDADDIPFD